MNKAEDYTQKQIEDIMQKICKKYKIKLQRGDGTEDCFNYCCSCNNEIILYPFNCKNKIERQLIAFFNEFSHCKLYKKVPLSRDNISKMQFELYIAMETIKFAKEKYNIIFSDDAVKWLIEEKFSYIDSENEEMSELVDDNHIIKHEKIKSHKIIYLMNKLIKNLIHDFMLIKEIITLVTKKIKKDNF